MISNDKPKKKIFVTRSTMPTYEEYIEAIKPLWDSHWLTNMGIYHQELERQLEDYLEVPEISLMVNGHMSLELAIQSFGFPEGAEVITTPFTFISTTHAIVRNRLKPVFCDVKESDGTIDEDRIEELITDKTVAIVPVHVYGHACNIEKIQEIADNYGLKVIFDAAHAFGVKYRGKGIGNYGDASIFSFHATKVYNTIEGGAVCCNNSGMYKKLYDLKDFGIRNEEVVASVGANAKMNEFSAIMGLCNLRHINEAIAGRERVYKRYERKINTIENIELFKGNPIATNNYSYFPVLFKDKESRDTAYEVLKKNDIYSRKYFYPLTSDHPCFKNMYKNCNLNIARNLSDRVLVLPFYDVLQDEDVDRICEIIKE